MTQQFRIISPDDVKKLENKIRLLANKLLKECPESEEWVMKRFKKYLTHKK